MDPYSFLNTAHTAYFAELYDQYLINPESVEPSWRAFFQGFEFGIDKVEKGELHIPENILKEFKVVKLINGYRTRGHLFTRTNPVRNRRWYRSCVHSDNNGNVACCRSASKAYSSPHNCGDNLVGIGLE